MRLEGQTHGRRTNHRYYWNEDCPQYGTEHNKHQFAIEGKKGWYEHCLGWHALVREATDVRARFHRPYLRGSNSNIIHRSGHEGIITWFPEKWYEEGPAYVAFWYVTTCCATGSLNRPQMLTHQEVLDAEPYYITSSPYDQIMLCGQCFNQPREMRGNRLLWKAVPRDGIALGSPDSEGRLAHSSSEVHHEEAGSSRDLRVSDPPRNFSQRDRWFAQS